MTELAGRTFLVTGANAGIGKSTAEELARRGGRVLLATRSAEKTAPVVEAIIGETGNTAVEHVPLDLADLESVRACARSLVERGEQIHVLINNAGVAGQRGQTKQGFELAFGTNHLGHFLLTTMLLDRLKECAPSRIVNVSSDSHYRAKTLDWDAVRRPTKGITGMAEYEVSKLANVLFTQELARRLEGSGVTTYSLHPGVIASEIWRRVPWPVRPIMTRFMKSTDEGAETTLHCATAPELANETGLFYDNCRQKAPNPASTPELAAELWSRSEEWTR